MRSPEALITPQSDYYVYSPSAMALEMLLYPICVGHFYCQPGYSLHRDTYDSYLVLYLADGTMTVSAGGRETLAQAGSFVLLDCYKPHAYRTDNGYECYWCHFDGVTAGAFCRHVIGRLGNVFSLGEPEIPRSGLEAIYRRFADGSAIREPEISQYLNDILTAFLLGSQHGEAEWNHHTMAEAVISYIGEHLNEPITVDMMARQAGLSTYHFIRTFRKATGFSPHEYLRNARLNMAKYLLCNTGLPLKEICRNVGFSCESVFCQAFRQSTGMTPTEYRSHSSNVSFSSL